MVHSPLIPFISAGQTTLVVAPDGDASAGLLIFDAAMRVWDPTLHGAAKLALMLLGGASPLPVGESAVWLATALVGFPLAWYAGASARQRHAVGATAMGFVATLGMAALHAVAQCCRCFDDGGATDVGAARAAEAPGAAGGARSGTKADAIGEDGALPHAAAVPRHIAVIMDGNRRYGAQQSGDRLSGHEAGGQTLVEAVKWCIELGVTHLTAYAFSTENWSRSPREIQTLMRVFEKYADELLRDALELRIRVHLLATDPHLLPPHVLHKLRELQRVTSAQPATRLTLNLCVSYGGRSELVGAARRLAAQVERGERGAETIDEAAFASELLTARHGGGSPDVDLLIRTSGEHRLSNFLLWQVAYAEMVFVRKMWPEFRRDDLRAAVAEYARRKRRFGA